MIIGRYELGRIASDDLKYGASQIEEQGYVVDLDSAETSILTEKDFEGKFKGFLMICFPVSKGGDKIEAACAVYHPKFWKPATVH